MGRTKAILSKSNIWGVDILIFVTVGTSSYQFNRILLIIDQLCDDGIIDGDCVFAQTGACDYIPMKYKYKKFLDYNEHQDYIDKANFIISHAGTGSIISALKKNKKVIAIPRFEEYGEHADNHQIELVNAFYKRGYILTANNKEGLVEQIKSIDKFMPNKFVSNNHYINEIVEDFICNI